MPRRHELSKLPTPMLPLVALVLLAAADGCTASHGAEPRPAGGCHSSRATAGVAPHYIFQSAEDGLSCVRLDLERFETSGASAVPNVTVRGPFGFVTALRMPGSCDEYDPLDIDFFQMSGRATSLETARGALELSENALVRADLEVTFGAARDGSLGPTSTTIVAEEVCLNAFCSDRTPEPCPPP